MTTILCVLGVAVLTGSGCLASAAVWPLSGWDWQPDTITSPYGIRQISGDFSYHSGIDLRASWGTPVYASDDGYVHAFGWNHPSKGNWIRLRHEDYGAVFETDYFHLQDHVVDSMGQPVSQGQLIGYSGNRVG